MAAPFTTPLAQPAKSYLLEMPPEIRNYIYDLVFAPDLTQEVELLAAKPSEKDLLMTCRQIHEEAKLVYRAAYRNFWRETRFVLNLTETPKRSMRGATCKSMIAAIKGLRQDDVANIRRLRLPCDPEYRDVLEDGAWVVHDRSGTQLELLAPTFYRSALEQAGYEMCDIDLPDLDAADLDRVKKDVEAAKSILRNRRMTVEELVAVVEDGWVV